MAFSSTSSAASIAVGESKVVTFQGTYLRTSAIKGQVTADEEPQEGITVTVQGKGEEKSTTTNATGQYSIESLRAGDLKPDSLPAKAKAIANWMMGDMAGLLNASGIELEESLISAQALRSFTDLIDSGVISGPAAKAVFEEMFRSGRAAMDIAEEQGLTQLNDDAQLVEAVDLVIRSNEQAVQDYLGGKETAIKFLLGQVMKETRGRANPASVTRLLEENLKAGAKG